MAYTIADDFTGSTINTSKWTEADSGSNVSQNNTLNIATTGTSGVPVSANSLKSVLTFSSGLLVVQCNLTWTGDNNGGEPEAGMYIYKDDDNTAQIMDRNDTGGLYRLKIVTGGVQRYSSMTAIAKGKDVKIVYNIDTGLTKFYYWNTNTWTQMGTDQTYSLGTPVYMMIAALQAGAANTYANPTTFDNAYISTADYSTQYPETPVATVTGGLRGYFEV